MDEACAVEQDVDRAKLVRERRDRLRRAHVELALIGVEARQARSVDVGCDDVRALASERLGRRPANSRRRGRQKRDLPRQSSRHEPLLHPLRVTK